MQQFPGVRTPLEIRVNDRVVNDTTITQVARFVGFTILQDEKTHECSCRMIVKVTPCANDAGQVGAPLTGPGFAPYTVALVADNNTILDENGAFLASRQPEHTQEEWDAVVARAPATAFFQGDYFDFISRTQPVLLDDLKRQHIEAAQHPPYSRYQ